MHGEKKVEFRKTRFQSDISHVVIYATRPVAGIVAYFTVRQVVELPIQQLWAKYKSVGGVDEQRFQDYYRYRETGIAIEVGEVIRLKRPIPLRSLSETAPIPQSFVYLPEKPLNSSKAKRKAWRELAILSDPPPHPPPQTQISLSASIKTPIPRGRFGCIRRESRPWRRSRQIQLRMRYNPRRMF